jgi:cyclopropane fatty-acyl-phospholipid synthase-like methyltransferase
METKNTPWIVEHIFEDTYVPSSDLHPAFYSNTWQIRAGNDAREIAEVTSHYPTSCRYDRESAERHAHLIVRAVNSFDALVNACEMALNEGDDYKAIEAIKEALKQAKGE